MGINSFFMDVSFIISDSARDNCHWNNEPDLKKTTDVYPEFTYPGVSNTTINFIFCNMLYKSFNHDNFYCSNLCSFWWKSFFIHHWIMHTYSETSAFYKIQKIFLLPKSFHYILQYTYKSLNQLDCDDQLSIWKYKFQSLEFKSFQQEMATKIFCRLW